MKKILYACVSNNGGMLRVAEWCKKFSSEQEEILFLIFTDKIFEESENLKCIEWKEDSSIFSVERVRHFSNEIQKKIDVSQIRCMIGDYLTLCYFEKFKIPFFYDVHILAKPMHEKINDHRKVMALDNDFLVFPLNSLIDVMSLDFMRFENKWIRNASGFLVNSKTTQTHLVTYYRDEVKKKLVLHVPLGGIKITSEIPQYSKRNFEYDCFSFARMHPQKGYHFLFYQDWQKSPLFVRGVPLEHIKPSGHELLKKNSITLLGWTDELEDLKRDILKSRFILFPSIYEPFGLALQEALSLGAICICHKNQSGHEEQITDKFNGFLIDMSKREWLLDLENIFKTALTDLDHISQNAINSAKNCDTQRNQKILSIIDRETFFLPKIE